MTIAIEEACIETVFAYPEIFLKGFSIGFLLCAPLGPIGFFCVRTTLMEGRMAGLLAVLGASAVDGIYALIAGLGISSVSHLLSHHKTLFELLGGLALVLLGVRLFFSSPSGEAPKARAEGLLSAFSTTFLVMLANPLPILAFTAGFAAMGVHGWKAEPIQLLFLVGGAFTGSCAWAPILVTAAGLFRFQFGPRGLRVVNRISGMAFVALGTVLGLLALAH